MIIELNADKNLTIHDEFRTKLTDVLTDELSRFSEHISRLIVHLSDENSSKNTINVKRCMMEARLEGKQPVAVSDLGDNYELAVNGAVIKMRGSLDSIISRSRKH